MCLGICTTSDYQATISESKERSLRAPPFPSLLLLLPLLLFLLLPRENESDFHIAPNSFPRRELSQSKITFNYFDDFPWRVFFFFFSLSLFLNPFLTAIRVFRKTVTRAIKLRVLRRETMPRVLRLRRRRRGYVTIAGAINLSTHTATAPSEYSGRRVVRYETVRLIFAYRAIDDGTCRLTVHPRTSWKSRSERCPREKK